jgi:hypothetical protein
MVKSAKTASATNSSTNACSRASYYGNSKCVETVWNSAPKIRGQDPELYRRDAYGNVLYKHSYGKPTQMGWHIDHIKPTSLGGSDHPRNLQVMQANKNMSLGAGVSKRKYK